MKVMLKSADVLADLVTASRDGGGVDESRSSGLVKELEALANGDVPAPSAAPVAAAKPAAKPAAPAPAPVQAAAPDR